MESVVGGGDGVTAVKVGLVSSWGALEDLSRRIARLISDEGTKAGPEG